MLNVPTLVNTIYEGEYKDGKKDGIGKLVDSTGVYEGEFKDNKKHGTGKMTYKDGGTYEGEWKEDMWNGKGKHISADGRHAIEGEFRDSRYVF